MSAPLAVAGTAAGAYPREGYRAVFTEPGAHMAVGSADIVDERTLHIEHFTYDGTAPLVYFYLAPTDTYADFLDNGIPIGPLLDRAYSDESLTVQLPEGQSLDGFTAISVWCAQFHVNFSSAEFAPRYARADTLTDVSMPGLDGVAGTAIILDERTIHLEHFSYAGGAPLVYFYLARTNDYTDFFDNGIPIGPELDRAYNDESVMVRRPAGETLNGFGALSVWCAVFYVNFGSGPFPASRADFDIDGDVDDGDLAFFESCATGPTIPQNDPACADTDLDNDLDVDQTDFGLAQRCISGENVTADSNCP